MGILIAYNLAKCRKNENLTQQELADKFQDISKASIALYENNKRHPSYEIQQKLSKELQISIEELNGKKELEICENQIKNELLKNKVNYNDYVHICDFFNHFFNYDSESETKKQSHITTYNYMEIMRKLKNAEHKIYQCSFSIFHHEKDKMEELINNISMVFNIFMNLIYMLTDSTHILYDSDRIHSHNIISSINVEQARAVVELTPNFLEILERLSNIESIQNSSVAVFYKNTSNIVDNITINSDIQKQISTINCIKVENNFMYPRFEENDIIILKAQAKYNEDDYVAISDENNDIYIGKLVLSEKNIILQPLNIKYHSLIFYENNYKIMGKIIETRYN